MRISDWSSDVCSSDLFCHQEACGCAVILLARVAHSDNAAFGRAECREALDRGVGAISLIMVEDDWVATLLRNRYRDDFIVEPPLAPCRRGELGRASCRERVCQAG